MKKNIKNNNNLIFLAGHNGFVGSAILRELKKKKLNLSPGIKKNSTYLTKHW